MPDFLNYTGDQPNAFAMSVMTMLEAEGFTVATTGQGPKADQRKTLRITWRGVFIGLMSPGLWGRKVPYACLYRFGRDHTRFSVAKAPQGFDKGAFARDHGCDPNALHVHSDYSGSYLWIKDEATSLLLMREWARRIDEAFFPSTNGGEIEQIQNDVRSILEDRSRSETERLAEVAVRLGQGKFRDDLEQEFGSACAATGLTVLPALRASHIVPWRSSVGAQRLDPKKWAVAISQPGRAIRLLYDYLPTERQFGAFEVCDATRLGKAWPHLES